MRAFHKSIRWRLQVWHGLLLLVVLAAFAVTAVWFIRENQLKRVDEELRSKLTALFPAIRPSGWMGRMPPRPGSGMDFPDSMRKPGLELMLTEAQQSLFEDTSKGSYYFVIWNEEGAVALQSAHAPADIPIPEAESRETGAFPSPGTPAEISLTKADPLPERGTSGFESGPHEWRGSHFPRTVSRGIVRARGEWRERTVSGPGGYRLLVGHHLAFEREELARLAGLFAIVAGGVLILGWLVGWSLSARAIRPIGAISVTARAIAAGNLSERINLGDTESELGELARVLNETFDRLQSAFTRQAQFTADASHELRTPAFVILSQAQSALKRARSAAEYREGFAVCQRAAQQMRQLVESLLILARQDAGESNLHCHPCMLDQIVNEAVDLLRPLAAERNVSLILDVKAVTVTGNARQLGQVVANLVSNAIEYNRPGGQVTVNVAQENGGGMIAVLDNGPGIAAEDLPHIFDRFYRADKSRSTADGHTGLGLAICKAIVEAHSGSIEVASRDNEGAVFTARIPS
jgi:heavy metal sensor kinase